MRVPFVLVDVFADARFTGNQLCVVPDAAALPPEVMQALATEIGFSESTFVTSLEPDRYEMRIFTPATEMPFAGHPSLGTAFVLASEGLASAKVTQRVPAGEFELEVDVDRRWVRMRQHPPTFGEGVDDLERIARAAGVAVAELHPSLRPQVVSTGLPHLMAPVVDADVVPRAHPDLRLLGPLLEDVGGDGLYLFAFEDGKARARLFAPGIGVDEDAATGSAAGPLGAYLAGHGVVTGRIEISQGLEIGRPSRLVVETTRDADSWAVHVSGGVQPVGRGAFELDL